MRRIGVLFAVALALLAVLAGPAGAAEPAAPPAQFADEVKPVLDRNVGRVVTLHLRSGQELTGTVLHVGERAVQLTKLAGRDYYDALVLIERVDAVLLKVWGK